MFKIFMKIALLIVLVGVLNVTVISFLYSRVTPYYWGSKALRDKRNYLVKNKDSFNVVFIGSSKTYYQVNAPLLDSLLENTKTFNFGIQSMQPPESFYIVENLILKDTIRPKYLVLELDWIPNIKLGNIFKRRTYYWLDFNYYKFINQVQLTSHIPTMYKVASMMTSNVTLLTKLYNIGKVNEVLNYLSGENDRTEIKDDDLLKTHGYSNLWRKKDFTVQEQKSISEVVAYSRSAFNDSNNDKYFNECFMGKINHLIKLGKENGIKIIFFLPPQWKGYQYKELLPVFNKIDNTNQIIVADVNQHPEFFEIENLYDQDHLNGKGSTLFTTTVAEKLRNCMISR
jgi:hypothetical protein